MAVEGIYVMGNIEFPPMDARASREQALAAKESGIDDIVWHNRDGVLKAFIPLDLHRGAVAEARSEQREETIRHAAEWLRTLGRDDMAVALVRALSVTGGR